MLFIDLSSMTGTLTQLISQVVSTVPKIAGAIIILLVGMLISKMVSKAVIKLLEKINIDKIGEKLNEIDIVEKSNIKVKLSTIFGKIIYYFLLVIFMAAAADVLQMPAISNLIADLFNLIPKLVVGFIILIFGIILSDGIKNLVSTTLTSLGISSAKMIANFLFYFLFINVVIVAIAQADINTDFLEQNISIIIAGAVLAFSIGYGLASKDSVGNFLASFYTKNKIEIGDVISIDEHKGEIINIDNNSVTIETDDRQIVYPLNHFMKEKFSIHK